jgi:hypothetical protein
LWAYNIIIRCHEFIKKYIYKKKTDPIHNNFKKQNYKVINQFNIKKIKSTKKILEKIIKKQQEKNHAGKHCSNL